MEIARRQLLGLGAAVAVSAATSSCRTSGQAPAQAGLGTSHARPAPRSPRPTFPGQPPAGSVYYGASLPYGRSVTSWERELGNTLGVHRSYFRHDADEALQLVAQCRQDLRLGRLPHVSVKPRGTWLDVGAGRVDPWLTSMLRPLGEVGSPILFTVHHEPENDAGPPGMQPADFVAMQRHVIDLAATLAPSVVVAPVLQHWTFDPTRDDVDTRAWLVPEAPVVGVDVYNPWAPSNTKPWRSFGSKLDEVIAWTGDTPVVVGEYGCRSDPHDPGLAAQWLRDAADYARAHHVISMSYFNSSVGARDGSWELTPEMQRTFADLLGSSWVARPA